MARALNVQGELVGVFVSVAYGVGIISALFSPGFIHRYGGVRVLQGVLAATAAMLLLAAGGSVAWLAIAAVVLGLGYGAAAPASTHLLVPHTPPRVFNMVMSLRQIGVPLGGVLGSLLLPPLVLHVGWREALLAELPGVLLLTALLQIPRRRWDADARSDAPAARHARCWHRSPCCAIGQCCGCRSPASSIPALQLCFVAFMTTQLTTVAGFDLITAGRALAIYQITGAVTRPIWGWIADNWLTPGHTLAVHGFGMAAAAVAAGQFGPHWRQGAAAGRHCRGRQHGRRLHRRCLRRIRPSRRRAAHRGDRPRHRGHVRRRAADPLQLRRGGGGVRRLRAGLFDARGACLGQRGSALSRPMGSPRRNGLNEAERALWASYAGRIRPLPGRPALPPVEVPDAAAPPEPAVVRASARISRAPTTPLAIGSHPGGVDSASWQRLRTGKLPTTRVLDLHGHTAQRAFHALVAFLRTAQAEGLRCVEVVTGQGSVLRRELPLWLNLPQLRGLVLAAAHPHAANPGSVRLLLRRAR